MTSSNRWIKGEDYPSWADSDVYKKTIQGGYLLPDETPKEAYMRVAKAVARRLEKPEMADKFFEYIWNGWLCLASPVLSNTGTRQRFTN
jgi:ribonucleoside-diphosphate reductase alpha chain